MRKFILLLGVCIIAADAFSLSSLLGYEGKVDVKDGSYLLTFSIYRGSGWKLWEEVHRGVPVKNHNFKVILGGISPIPESVWNGDIFLEWQLDSKTLGAERKSRFIGNHEPMTSGDKRAQDKSGWVSGKLYGTYVGQTTAQYDGNLGGYEGANAKCATEFPGSHLCATIEILMSIYEGMTVGDGLIAGGVYIKDIRLGGTEIFSDCEGFTTAEEEKHCTIWFGGGFPHPGGMRCSEVHSLLCCK